MTKVSGGVLRPGRQEAKAAKRAIRAKDLERIWKLSRVSVNVTKKYAGFTVVSKDSPPHHRIAGLSSRRALPSPGACRGPPRRTRRLDLKEERAFGQRDVHQDRLHPRRPHL